MKINIIQNLFERDKAIIRTEHGTEIVLDIGESIYLKQFGSCIIKSIVVFDNIPYMNLVQINDPTSDYLITLTDEFIKENFGASYENDNFHIVDVDIDQLL